MILKDRIKQFDHQQKVGHGSGYKQKKEICKHFNKGLCTAGLSCKYDHHCLECGKFGHGAHICQKRNQTSTQVSQVSPQNNNGMVTNTASTSGMTSQAGRK